MNENIQDKLLALHNAYAEKLPEKILYLKSLWQTLQQDWQPATFDTFHREVHSICGSSALYGYHALSEVARELEMFLRNISDSHAEHTPKDDAKISELLSKFMIAK